MLPCATPLRHRVRADRIKGEGSRARTAGWRVVTARVTLLPSARRLMDSLREIGYDLPTGIADIVDNSIAARAQRVDVTFAFEGADSWIRIADDGAGMSAALLD